MDNLFSNIKERVLLIADNQQISKEIFFTNIGMTYGSFKGNAKKTPLNSDAVANILSIYPEINPIWLITGKGEMLMPKSAVKSAVIDNKSAVESAVITTNSTNSVKESDNIIDSPSTETPSISALQATIAGLEYTNGLQVRLIDAQDRTIALLEYQVSELQKKCRIAGTLP